MNKVATGIILSVAGPAFFWVPRFMPVPAHSYSIGQEYAALIILAYTFPFLLLIVAGYFYGRELGAKGIGGCLIGPILFLAIDIEIQVAHPPPEHAFLDLLVFIPLMGVVFALSLIPATIGIFLRRRMMHRRTTSMPVH